MISWEELDKARKEFDSYASKAEQSEFVQLAAIDGKMRKSYAEWKADGIDQSEAQSMLHVLSSLGYIDPKDFPSQVARRSKWGSSKFGDFAEDLDLTARYLDIIERQTDKWPKDPDSQRLYLMIGRLTKEIRRQLDEEPSGKSGASA